MNSAAGVARGLEYMHDKGVLYRCVKSSDILLGDGYHPKLSQYGLAETAMAGNGTAGTATGAGTGVAPGAGAGIGVKETVKWESSVRGVAVVVPVLLEGVPRMVRGRSLIRRERKRKRRRAAGTVQILMIQRL